MQAPVIDRVLKTISRYNMLAPAGRVSSARPAADRQPTRVAVAVSGGPDSVCLLHVLAECAPRLGVVLSVAHFNHKLRGAASDDDEGFVSKIANRMGLPMYRAEADPFSLTGNLEQAARDGRRAFFARLRQEDAVDLIALGHTRDDQAETVLFRILRGSGLAGLAGVLPVTAEGLIRPLINVTRFDVESYMRERGLEARVDSTNAELRFARNRIRQELLPQLEQEWNPNVSEALSQLADLAYDEERWWNAAIERRAAKYLVERADGIEFQTHQLAALPRALARRLIRRAITGIKGDVRGTEFEHVERVLELVELRAGEGQVTLPGLRVTRSFDWIRMEPLDLRVAPGEMEVAIPSRITMAEGGPTVMFEVADAPCATLKAAQLSLKRLPASVRLRGWRPGDQYCPLGHKRGRKIHDLFQQARIPSWLRLDWPIVTGGGRILWARQFGAAAEFAANAGESPVLRIFETAEGNR